MIITKPVDALVDVHTVGSFLSKQIDLSYLVGIPTFDLSWHYPLRLSGIF